MSHAPPPSADRLVAPGGDSPAGAPESAGPLTRRRLVLGGLSIVAALLGLYLLVPRLAGLNQTWGRLSGGDPLLLAVAAVTELLSILGYAILFRTVFGRDMPRIDWRASIEIPLAGIAAIRLLAAAGAGGVAVTVWALSRAGMAPRVIGCRMVASYVIQYSIYLLAIIVCGLGLYNGAFPGGGSYALTIVPAGLSAIAVVLVASMALVPRDFERRLQRIAQRSGRSGQLAARFATAPATLGAGVRTAIALVRERRVGLLGAVAYWGFDIAVLGLSFRAFGSVVPVAVLVMGYFLGTLGSVLPLPGGIGGVEGGMIGAFAAFGVPGSTAVVAVLAYRAISFWLPTLPGIIGYISLRSTVRTWRLADGVGANAAAGAAATATGDERTAATATGDERTAATATGDERTAATATGDERTAATTTGDERTAATARGDERADGPPAQRPAAIGTRRAGARRAPS